MGDDAAEQLFASHRSSLDEDWHDTFDQLTAQGNSPTGILATIEYVTTTRTQQEVAQEYNISEVTIRNLQAAVVALGPLDQRRDAQHDSRNMTAIEYCTHVADTLEWEEGVEYSVTESGYGNSPQPSLLKEGWRSLYEHIAPAADGGER